jgi:hypothetical protein
LEYLPCASRFIESLLLGLPVPAIFLYKETDSNKHLVIDGQQRLRTLQFFYKGLFEPANRSFQLKGVNRRFDGKTYSALAEEDKLRLDDSIIHSIIVKQEQPKEDHVPGAGPSSVYHIFERLNTGGVLLHPQEIRSCVYHGPLIELLDQLNKDVNWRTLFGTISSRMRDRELILRFFALTTNAASYSKPMKEFLNTYAETHRKITPRMTNKLRSEFAGTVATIKEGIGANAFKTTRAINAALCDAIMVGVASRLRAGPITNLSRLKSVYAELLKKQEFLDAISSSTTDEARVAERIRLAKEAFQEVS